MTCSAPCCTWTAERPRGQGQRGPTWPCDRRSYGKAAKSITMRFTHVLLQTIFPRCSQSLAPLHLRPLRAEEQQCNTRQHALREIQTVDERNKHTVHPTLFVLKRLRTRCRPSSTIIWAFVLKHISGLLSLVDAGGKEAHNTKSALHVHMHMCTNIPNRTMHNHTATYTPKTHADSRWCPLACLNPIFPRAESGRLVPINLLHRTQPLRIHSLR